MATMVSPANGSMARSAIERPPRQTRAIAHDVAPGQDVTAFELNRVGHPLRVRLTADQHEERGRRDLLSPTAQPVVQREGVEVIRSVAVGDLGVQANRDVGPVLRLTLVAN